MMAYAIRAVLLERYARDLSRLGRQKPGQPWLLCMIFAGHAHHGRSADDKEAPKVPATLLCNTAEPFLAA